MKNIFILLALVLICISCTKTKTNTNTVTVTNYDTVYSYTRNLWYDASNTGLTLSFTKDSIYETLASFSPDPWGYPYTVLTNDTINLPLKSIKIILTVTKDSLIYNAFQQGVITRFYRN